MTLARPVRRTALSGALAALLALAGTGEGLAAAKRTTTTRRAAKKPAPTRPSTAVRATPPSNVPTWSTSSAPTTVPGVAGGETLAAAAARPDAEYPIPADVAQEPAGTLLRAEPADLLPTASSWRVLYHSRSATGGHVVVSGLVVTPTGPPPAEGWPVVIYTHGTVGLADRCAPSKKPSLLELAAFAAIVAQGYAIVATDYEGLGTPGRHPYLVGVSEGRSALDIARAARAIPGARLGTKVAIYGYSQGGHAALFAAELAQSWAPELTLVGAVAGAPPSQFSLEASRLAGSPFRGYLLMVVGGFAAAYRDLPLDDVLTPAGQSLLPVVDRGCTQDVFRAVNTVALDTLLKASPTSSPAWRDALSASEPGRRIAAPVLIVHGDRDEQVPVETSAALTTRLCAAGTVVERKVYPGQNHTGGAVASLRDATSWILDRFSGKTPPTSCG